VTRQRQRGDTTVDKVNCTLRLTICSLENHVRHLSYAVLWRSGMARKNPAIVQRKSSRFPVSVQRGNLTV
jgi:hypothetical protein